MPPSPGPRPPKIPRPWAAAAPPADAQTDLLEPEYRAPVLAYLKSPTPHTAGPVLDAVSPVIDEAMRSYAGTESQAATARAKAKTLTLEAVRRYDPARAKLRTHLLSHLRGLRRAVERQSGGVYVPEQWRIDSRTVAATHADLRDELGRDPSDAEVADRTRIPLDRVRRSRKVPLVMGSSRAGGEGVQLAAPSERAWNKWVEGVYHELHPTDQVVLEHSFGLFGNPVSSGQDVAKRLNLSPGAVSQRKARIQGMLDEFDSFMGSRQ